MDPKKRAHDFYQRIKFTMDRKDIMTFVSGLHDVQAEMIEELVRRKEAKGFPEATAVINDIIANKGKYGRVNPNSNGEIK